MPTDDQTSPHLSPLTADAFDVPINLDGAKGRVVVLFPCDDAALREFVREEFSVEASRGTGNWAGRCFFSKELDAKVGLPTVVVGLALWGPNPSDPSRGSSHQLGILAHECFHVAELLLQKVDSPPPEDYGQEGVVWEDAAFLVQGIMRRALEKLPVQATR